MERINQLMENQAGTLSLTDPEPYILSDEEAQTVIENELIQAQKYFAWRMAQKGLSEGEILLRTAEKDWHSAIDFESVLLRANSSKTHAAWEKVQREKDRQEEAKKRLRIESTWTALEMYKHLRAVVRENGKELIANEDTLPLIKTLCYFLSDDPRFEKELGYTFSKGLWLRGVSGLGKSFLVECLSTNERNPVMIYSMITITEKIKKEGYYQIPYNSKIIYLDDVGTEELDSKNYGSKITFFKNFIEVYYSENQPFNRLMVSTNNSFQEIEDRYGFRVRSRVKDMFNIIDVTGKDLRG